jgi:hypothetical protein
LNSIIDYIFSDILYGPIYPLGYTMSFFIDKALLGLRKLEGTEDTRSAQERQEEEKFYNEAQKYRDTIYGWLIDGVPREKIKQAGLWIDELLQPKLTIAGGPPSGGSGILPVLIPPSRRQRDGRLQPEYVTRTVRIFQTVSRLAADTRDPEALTRALSNMVRQPGDATVGQLLDYPEDEKEMKLWEDAYEGDASALAAIRNSDRASQRRYEGWASTREVEYIANMRRRMSEQSVGNIPEGYEASLYHPRPEEKSGRRKFKYRSADYGHNKSAKANAERERLRNQGFTLIDMGKLKVLLYHLFSSSAGLVDVGIGARGMPRKANEVQALISNKIKGNPALQDRILEYLESAGFDFNLMNEQPSDIAMRILSTPSMAARTNMLRDIVRILGVPEFSVPDVHVDDVSLTEAEHGVPASQYVRDHRSEIEAKLSEYKMPADLQGTIIDMLEIAADNYAAAMLRPEYEESIKYARDSAREFIIRHIHELYEAQKARFRQLKIDDLNLPLLVRDVMRMIPGLSRPSMPSLESGVAAIQEAKQLIPERARRQIIESPLDEDIEQFRRDASHAAPDMRLLAPGVSETKATSWPEFARRVILAQRRPSDALFTISNWGLFRERQPRALMPPRDGEIKDVDPRKQITRRAVPRIEAKGGDEIDEKHVPGREETGDEPPGGPPSGPPGGGPGPGRGGGPPSGGPVGFPGGGGGGGGGPPGGPPDGGPPGGYVFQAGRWAWRFTTFKNLLAALAAIGWYVIGDRLKKALEKDGEVVIAPPPKEDDGGEDDSHTNIPSDGVPALPQPPMNDRTYEPAPDGRPRLFPVPIQPDGSDFISPNSIPSGTRVPSHKLDLPKFSRPKLDETFAPARDTVQLIDTEDSYVQEIMDEVPESRKLIAEFNANATKLNYHRALGNYQEAEKDYRALRLASVELEDLVSAPISRTGYDKYEPISLRDLEYDGTNVDAGSVRFNKILPKTERTSALGLDRVIDKYNSAVNELNSMVNAGFDQRTARGSQLARWQQLTKDRDEAITRISDIQSHPENAAGTLRPRLITGKYPPRIVDILEDVQSGKRVNLTDNDLALLEKYPTLSESIVPYAKITMEHPEGYDSNELQSLRNNVTEAVLASPLGTSSSRPIVHAPHKYPPDVQAVINKIASSRYGSPVELTDRDRAIVADYPELAEKVRQFERVGNVFESRTLRDNAIAGVVQEFKDMQKLNYTSLRESDDVKVGEIESRIAGNRAALSTVDKKLRAAIAADAPRAYINDLNIQSRRLRALIRDDTNEIAGRGTYLPDEKMERLPDQANLDIFRRLQNAEAELQGRQDLLEQYNAAVATMNPEGLSPEYFYNRRLELIKRIMAENGLSSAYAAAIDKPADYIPEDDTIVRLPDDVNATVDQGEGTARAEMVDPAEQKLFLRSPAEEARERRMWEEYSYVPPGFGLGGADINPLQRANMQFDRRRFSTAHLVPDPKPPKPVPIKGRPSRQVRMTPIYQSAFGEDVFEDAYHNDYQQGKHIIWTPTNIDSGDMRTWYNPRNIYEPDFAGHAFAMKVNTPAGRHAVPIGEVSKPPEYYGTNKRFYRTNGPSVPLQNIANRQPPYGEQTMITTERSGYEDRHPRPAPRMTGLSMPLFSTRG